MVPKSNNNQLPIVFLSGFGNICAEKWPKSGEFFKIKGIKIKWPTVSAYVRQLLTDCQTECQTRFLSLQKHWSRP